MLGTDVMGKRGWVVAGLATVLALSSLVALTGWPLAEAEDPEQREGPAGFVSELLARLGGSPACGDGPLLTVPPIDPDEIDHIVPLGNLNPAGHTFPVRHMYWNFGRNGLDGRPLVPETVEVVAPADIVLDGISSLEYVDRGFTDYELSFEVCEDVRGYFIHLSGLTADLQDAIGAGGTDCFVETPDGQEIRHCFVSIDVELKAGEILGSAGGEGGGVGLDFGLQDARSSAYVARDQGRDLEHVVCPLEYYPTQMQEALRPKLGRTQGDEIRWRTEPPLCGTPHWDVAGTASGRWFDPDHVDERNESHHVALAGDNVDPDVAVFSLGMGARHVGLDPGTYPFSPRTSGRTDRAFADVTADGQVYCYEVDGFDRSGRPIVLLVTLPDPDTLWLGRNRSESCGEVVVSDAGYAAYTR